MSGDINYKQKYQDLKTKFMQSVDMAFRLGFVEGSKQSQLDNANQQLQMQQDHAQNMASLNQPKAPGMPSEDGQPQEVDDGSQPQQLQSENPAGSELDQHIATLEGMVNKSEDSSGDLQKALDGLRSLQKSLQFAHEMKKSQEAIPAIAKNLHKPAFKLNTLANHNMNSTAKAAVTMQEGIVQDMMSKWEQEERKASESIVKQLNVEGLTKGE
jgi:myosin heavy subunit